MSSYIPPHMRGQKKTQKKPQENKSLANTDENFPSLGASHPVKKTGWDGPKSFASLATEWKEHEIEQKTEDDYRRVHEVRTRAFVVSRVHHQEFDPIHEDSYDDAPTPAPTQQDEWTTISRKVKVTRDKAAEERDKEMDEEMQRETSGNREDDSMWTSNQPKEYETYWDERRY